MNSFSVSLQLLLCLAFRSFPVSVFFFFFSSSYVAVVAPLWSGFHAAVASNSWQPLCSLLLPSILEAGQGIAFKFAQWAGDFHARPPSESRLSFREGGFPVCLALICTFSVARAGRAQRLSRHCCCNRKFHHRLRCLWQKHRHPVNVPLAASAFLIRDWKI